MLDTNAWISYLKNPGNKIGEALRDRRPHQIVTCEIVRAELLHGAMKYGVPARRWALVRETLAPLRSLPLDELAAEHYARLRHGLERTGERIGPNDLFIAAICLANDCTLVTSNLGEFRRVPGLRVEDWNVAPSD